MADNKFCCETLILQLICVPSLHAESGTVRQTLLSLNTTALMQFVQYHSSFLEAELKQIILKDQVASQWAFDI